MKRSDIKNNTIYLIIFCVVAFALIWILKKNPEKEKDIVAGPKGVLWSDTLSNAASDIAALKKMDSEIEYFRSKWELKGCRSL